MAGLSNMKFYYVVVTDGMKTVFTRQCLNAKDANELFAKKKEEFKDSGFLVLKEHY